MSVFAQVTASSLFSIVRMSAVAFATGKESRFHDGDSEAHSIAGRSQFGVPGSRVRILVPALRPAAASGRFSIFCILAVGFIAF